MLVCAWLWLLNMFERVWGQPPLQVFIYHFWGQWERLLAFFFLTLELLNFQSSKENRLFFLALMQTLNFRHRPASSLAQNILFLNLLIHKTTLKKKSSIKNFIVNPGEQSETAPASRDRHHVDRLGSRGTEFVSDAHDSCDCLISLWHHNWDWSPRFPTPDNFACEFTLAIPFEHSRIGKRPLFEAHIGIICPVAPAHYSFLSRYPEAHTEIILPASSWLLIAS